MNTIKLKNFVLEHFSLNLSDEDFKVIFTGKENFKETKLISACDKGVLFIPFDKANEKISDLDSALSYLSKLDNKTMLYYFVSDRVKVNRVVSKKYTFNLVSEKLLEDFFNKNTFDDDIYITSSDTDVLGIFEKDILVGVVSLIKFDGYYDLCIAISEEKRNQKLCKILLSEYLKYEKKDKTIRLLVDKSNIAMVKALDKLGLKPIGKIIEA